MYEPQHEKDFSKPDAPLREADENAVQWQVRRDGAAARGRALKRKFRITSGRMMSSAKAHVANWRDEVGKSTSQQRRAYGLKLKKLDRKLDKVDLTPDLADAIGSRKWFRGFGTLVGLSALAVAFWPSFSAVTSASAATLTASAADEYRSQAILPLALGADSGRRMGATALVQPLAAAPERPQLQLLATFGRGDTLKGLLRRAGLRGAEADYAIDLIAGGFALEDIEPGTQFDITLGRRESDNDPRPLDALSFRARFDLELNLTRSEDGLSALEKNFIRVDDTPLRITGTVGDSLYRSARAAGAPASAVQQYLKALGGHIDVSRSIASGDTFDMILAHRRAATGERQAGQLLYAGIERGETPRAQIVRFGEKGEFFDANGRGEEKGGLMRPVPGSMSSGYGMRRHPVLGYRRMHAGLDFRGRTGTPIRAVTDGRVTGAGRMGGCGIAVRLKHAGNLSTRYCHMSRMAVKRGQNVKRGQVIGYIGSTGLSTGPHLHYEMYRGNRHIDPRSVNFVTRAQLSGGEVAKLRERIARLKTVEVGAALAPLEIQPTEVTAPKREIEKLDQVREIG